VRQRQRAVVAIALLNLLIPVHFRARPRQCCPTLERFPVLDYGVDQHGSDFWRFRFPLCLYYHAFARRTQLRLMDQRDHRRCRQPLEGSGQGFSPRDLPTMLDAQDALRL